MHGVSSVPSNFNSQSDDSLRFGTLPSLTTLRESRRVTPTVQFGTLPSVTLRHENSVSTTATRSPTTSTTQTAEDNLNRSLASSEVNKRLFSEPRSNTSQEAIVKQQPPKAAESVSTHQMVTRSKAGIVKPNPRYVLFNITAEHTEPRTVKEALKHPGWNGAMTEEMVSFDETDTFTLVPYHPDMHILGCRWIFRIKLNADGSVKCLRSRLVVKGYDQEEGIDYLDTYSPVVKSPTIRAVLHFATVNKWDIRQLDVKHAFLYGDLEETVYMHQPPGFINPEKPTHVCKLNKAIYGLKQAPRAWFNRFSDFLLSFGFICSIRDPSLFIYRRNGDVMLLLLYVDDIALTGSNKTLIGTLLTALNKEFRMKDLGCFHYFLGLQAHFLSNGLFLNQEKYAEDLLHISGMSECTPVATPLPLQLNRVPDKSPLFPQPTYFRSLAGKLQYLTLTRPDLQFAVNYICQRMHAPTDTDFQLLKRVLRYLRGTTNFGISFYSDTDFTVRAYSDSDWGGCPDTRRSTGGFCTFLGSNIISWSAQKQQSVSRSSTEAEYRTLSDTAAELVWLINLMREIGIPHTAPPELYCDNLSAVYLSATPAMHKRSKHFEVNFHFVRERVASGSLIVHHIPGAQQLADIFTKSLSTQNFQNLRFKLGVVGTPTQSLRGHVDRREERDKEMKVWIPKKKSVSELHSVSETEKKINVDSESNKLFKAETSFVNNEMGLRDTTIKPIQSQSETTATKETEIKNRAKDKSGGPAEYDQEQPITLRNSFALLESNEDLKT
ncbi:hypothetical protein Bca101_016189 [Brassica carinata]